MVGVATTGRASRGGNGCLCLALHDGYCGLVIQGNHTPLWLFGRAERRQMTDAPVKKQGAADNVPVAELKFIAKPDSGNARASAIGDSIEKPLRVLDVGFLPRRFVRQGVEEEGGGALGPSCGEGLWRIEQFDAHDLSPACDHDAGGLVRRRQVLAVGRSRSSRAVSPSVKEAVRE